MKKMLALALALFMLLLAGCGNKTPNPEETEKTDEVTQSAESTTEGETTTEFTGEASYVLCGFAKDVVDLEGWDEALPPPYETFVADVSEYSEMLAFMKNEGGNVSDFKLYKLEYVETPSEELPHFKAEEIYHRDTLSDIDPILIQLTFFGTIPSYGFSFVDEYGMKSYALSLSGMDGSLVMPEIVLE